jgi:autotransporter-associated beta strand protein
LQFEINDAGGTAGTDPGWDLLTGSTLNITATSGSEFTIDITSLNGSSPGNADGFNSSGSYKWKIADFVNDVPVPDASAFILLRTNFTNSNTGTWAIKRGDASGVGGTTKQLWLTYDPPPPGTYWAPVSGGGGSGTWTSSATVWATGAGVQGFGPQATGKLTFGDNAGTVTVNNTVTVDAGMDINTTGYMFVGGTGTPKINLTGVDASANTITVGSSVTATISVALDGSAGMTKAGTGILVLGAPSTYTGATAVNAGTLQVDGSLAVGSTVAVGTDGTLSGNGTINGAATLTGNGIINKSAGNIAGTLGVTGGNWNGAGSVGGLVTSSSGTFKIGNGANLTASVGVSVTSGGALVGTGTITGPVGVQSGGTLAPGTDGTVGELKVTGTTTFASGSTFKVDVSGGTVDKLTITGAASITTGANLVFNVLSNPTANEYVIATTTLGGLETAFTCSTVPTGYTLQATTTQLSLKKVPGGTVIMFK